MALKAGTVGDFANSMAAAMEKALQAEWASVKGTAFPTAGEEDRHLLFVAIAQGIVRYLKDNAESSIIIHDVQVTQGAGNDIASSGTAAADGAGDLHTHAVSVTQNTGPANRATSTGTGQARIETTGVLH